MKATIENQLGIISSLAAMVLIVAGVLSFQNTQRLILVNSRVAKTNEVLAAISQTFSAIQGAQNDATDFAMVRDEPFRNRYFSSVAQAEGRFDHLRRLTSDDPRQQSRLNRLDDQIENAFSIFPPGDEPAAGGGNSRGRTRRVTGCRKNDVWTKSAGNSGAWKRRSTANSISATRNRQPPPAAPSLLSFWEAYWPWPSWRWPA